MKSFLIFPVAAFLVLSFSTAEASQHHYRSLQTATDGYIADNNGRMVYQPTNAHPSRKSTRLASHGRTKGITHRNRSLGDGMGNPDRAAPSNGYDMAQEGLLPAEWPRTLHKNALATNGTGIIRSAKTGATARVSPKYAAQFQGYIDDIERGGSRVLFMGGYRKGICWSGGRHPCGMALDVCQLGRGRVDRRCNLPGPAAIIKIAAAHGLLEGAVWGSSDYGHAQASGSFGNTYAASARRHVGVHRKIRMARR